MLNDVILKFTARFFTTDKSLVEFMKERKRKTGKTYMDQVREAIQAHKTLLEATRREDG